MYKDYNFPITITFYAETKNGKNLKKSIICTNNKEARSVEKSFKQWADKYRSQLSFSYIGIGKHTR